MRFVILLIVVLISIFIWGLAYTSRPRKPTRREVTELQLLRDLMYSIEAEAFSRIGLPGETMPEVVIDLIRSTQKQIQGNH